MNKIKKIILVILPCMAVSGFVFVAGNVFGYAGESSTTQPAINGCPEGFSTCYGYGWELYNKDETPSGTTRLQNGDLHVHSDIGNITGGGTIKVTACKKNYWRLAYYYDHNGIAGNNYHYNKNDQIGMMTLSEAIDNTQNYRGAYYNSNLAKEAWDRLTDEERMGYVWNSSSNLSWFCEEPAKVTLTAYAVTDYRKEGGTEYRKYLVQNGSSVGESGWEASPPDNAYKKIETVDYGNSVSVTMDATKGNYEWNAWGSSCSNIDTADNRKCTVNSLNSNKTVYAYYKLPKYILTAYAVTGYDSETGEREFLKNDGTVSKQKDPPNDAYRVIETADYGDSASVTMPASLGNYEWNDWGDSCKVTGRTPDGTKCTVNPLNGNTTVYAYYAESAKFSGYATVSSGASSESTKDLGYINNIRTTQILKLNNCYDGCNIKWEYSISQTTGLAGSANSSWWILSKKYNSLDQFNPLDLLKRGKYNGGSQEGEPSYDEPDKIYTGEMVCRTLAYKSTPESTKLLLDTVCVVATGDLLSSIDMHVSKDGGKNFYKEVYAKPGDTLTYKTVYNPKAQRAYNSKPSKMKINGGGNLTNENGSSLGELFNENHGDSLKNWNNGFYRSVTNSNAGFDKPNVPYALGLADKQEEFGDILVSSSNVGREMKGTAETNKNDVVSTTPKEVIFSFEGGELLTNVITDNLESSASAKIPYNFINSTSVRVDSEGVLYAGESVHIEYDYIVGTKQNSETGGKYATNVDAAKGRIGYCLGTSDECEYNGNYVWSEENERKIKVSTNLMYIGKTEAWRTEMVIPDLAAGTNICVKSSIYPRSSGSDTNLDPKGSNSWTFSDPKCFKIAKKPSFQIWGGGLYSAGNIKTSVSEKNYGVFGSWAELDVTAGGLVTGLASGAGTGYGATSDAVNPAVTPENSGGGESGNYCKRSTLSFANEKCSTGEVGGLGSSSGAAQNSILSYISEVTGGNNGSYIIDNNNGGGLTSDGESIQNITTNTVGSGVTKIIYAKGKNVNIRGNITYNNDNDGNGYKNFESTPKFIIYAENIFINCGVTRVDAVLIADGNINTCDNDDVNSSNRSHQLKINGAIIANTLTLNRTYGAATGNNSIIPAEIINYDSTLYSRSHTGVVTSADGNSLTRAYSRELAPRY